MTKLFAAFLSLVFQLELVVAPVGYAQEANSIETDRMEWWRDARFGMFVHWGLYSGLAGEWDDKSLGLTGNMEWAQHRAKIDSDAYAAKAIPLFKPKPGFAADWAKLAKQAGFKYLVFTTKHHDGFALHDSSASEYDAGSVLNRDLVEEIVEACRAEQLKVGFYHSVIDWHHDQFAYAESDSIPHPLRGRPYPKGERDHRRYVEYLHTQVSELVNNYGPIDVMWWDYSVPDFEGERAWKAFSLMEIVRRVQPKIVMNNRLFRRPEAGYQGTKKMSTTVQLDPRFGDFMTPEQHVPDTGIPGVDWETCMTINTTWGYSKHDHNWKSTKTLVRTLVDVASKGGNLLLNVGPMADGTIPQESVERLNEIGRWLQVSGKAIYGTTASPIAKPSWGRITAKPKQNTLYLHVFHWPADQSLAVAGLPEGDYRSTVLSGNQEVPVIYEGNKLALDVTGVKQDPFVTVIRLEDVNKQRKTQETLLVERNKKLHSDGQPWGFKRATNSEADLPKVLLIGDSILNGYRGYVTKALSGKAVVDLWVNPHYQSEKLNRLLGEMLEHDTYDVVHFNVGLHGWQQGRIKQGTFKPLTRSYVEVIRAKQPDARLIWASSTPVTSKGNPAELEPDINPVIVAHNRMAAEVMHDMDVRVNDFYGVLVDKLELARGDRFHWTPSAYKLLGEQAAELIITALATQGNISK